MRLLLILIILGSIGIAITTLTTREVREDAFMCEGCNVILISIDTFGAKHSSVYSPALSTTPFMQELATRSIVFENAFSQAPWTLPSHAAMLTGQYPWDIGVWESTDRLPDRVTTIAESLKDHGYTTTAFSGGAFVQPYHGFDQGFDAFHGSIGLYDWNDVPRLFDDVETWLTDTPSEQPFFLFIRPFGLHDPYGAPGASGTIEIRDIVTENTREGGPSDEASERFMEAYRAEVRDVDTALQHLFETLTERGLIENTIVIITSDHGEEFGEHGTIGFHSVALYRESIWVPLMVYLPSDVSRRVTSTVEIRSIPGTILDLLSLPDESGFDAPSLLPLMTGTDMSSHLVQARTHQERNHLLSIIEQHYTNALTPIEPPLPLEERTKAYAGGYAESAILGSWQAIRTLDDFVELYDTRKDMNETQNLIERVRFLPYEDRASVTEVLDTIKR